MERANSFVFVLVTRRLVQKNSFLESQCWPHVAFLLNLEILEPGLNAGMTSRIMGDCRTIVKNCRRPHRKRHERRIQHHRPQRVHADP